MSELIVCESYPSYRYHVRKKSEKNALCGIKPAWDTRILIKTFGLEDGHSKYCKDCASHQQLNTGGSDE